MYYIKHNPYGTTPEEQAANQIVANMPAPQTVADANAASDAQFYATIYKNIWGKDLESLIATKESQLRYLRMAVKQAPATKSLLQPQINKLKKEIDSLRWKSYYYMGVRGVALMGGISLIGALTYNLIKRANK